MKRLALVLPLLAAAVALAGCGGSSGHATQPTIQQAFQVLPESKTDRVQVIMGHLWYGAHALLPRPATYLTVLRDPIDRIISHYYFVQRDERHYLHQVVQGMSLEEYMSSGSSTEMLNDQTRLLAGGATAETGHLSADVLATATDVLAVPVNALLALAGGGYAVEVADPAGTHHLVTVALGIFDDAAGLVQVSGAGLSAGC